MDNGRRDIAMPTATKPHGSKTKFLDAALYVFRERGYAATTVDDICEKAGLTKGSFFHHFDSKEDLAVSAARHFSEMADGLFAGAAYWRETDPVERFLGYIDFRRDILRGDLPDFTCLLGTMTQETYATHPAIRDACREGFEINVSMLEPIIAEAMQACGVAADWSARSLALYTQAVLQGAFVLAKAEGGTETAVESVAHLRRYVELLFNQHPSRGSRS
jgi:TetR/AcrR family transcriptional repressor of nem operon